MSLYLLNKLHITLGYIQFVITFKYFIYLFLEGREGRGKESERNQCVRHLQLGTWSTTQACAQTGNQISDLLFTGRYSIH